MTRSDGADCPHVLMACQRADPTPVGPPGHAGTGSRRSWVPLWVPGWGRRVARRGCGHARGARRPDREIPCRRERVPAVGRDVAAVVSAAPEPEASARGHSGWDAVGRVKDVVESARASSGTSPATSPPLHTDVSPAGAEDEDERGSRSVPRLAQTLRTRENRSRQTPDKAVGVRDIPGGPVRSEAADGQMPVARDRSAVTPATVLSRCCQECCQPRLARRSHYLPCSAGV